MTKQEEYRVKKYFVDALVKADLSVNSVYKVRSKDKGDDTEMHYIPTASCKGIAVLLRHIMIVDTQRNMFGGKVMDAIYSGDEDSLSEVKDELHGYIRMPVPMDMTLKIYGYIKDKQTKIVEVDKKRTVAELSDKMLKIIGARKGKLKK